jgi:sec-independent protein translocase protein TatC
MSKDRKKKDKGSENLAEGTLISHLLELRDRLVKAMLGMLVPLVPTLFFRKELFALMVAPIKEKLGADDVLLATGVMTPFMMPVKLAFFTSLFIAMPWVLYQIWAFVAPGLYRKEKRFAVPLLVSSILLFYVGMAFAYFAVFPVAFGFFAEQGLLGVQYAPEINGILNFVLATFFAFGIAFEVPVVVVLLAVTGMVSHAKLTAARGYVIIGVFVAAAVLTPPDPISQIMMAIPMWMLYEAGLVMARMLSRPAKTKEGAGADAA